MPKQLLILWCLVGASVDAETSIPVEAFATPPDISDIRLSPDGENLAFLRRLSKDGVYGRSIGVFNLEAKQSKILGYASVDDFVVNWVRWANNDQLLMSAVFAQSRDGVPTTETRLIVIDIRSGEYRRAIADNYLKKQARIPQFQDQIVDLLPSQPDHILLSGRFGSVGQSRVLKVNLRSGKTKAVQRDKTNVFRWMTDRQERLRIAFWRSGTDYRILHKAVDSKSW
ncbi:MAG: hypothetical protein WBN61_03995 [Woeseiaceae bacterium]